METELTEAMGKLAELTSLLPSPELLMRLVFLICLVTAILLLVQCFIPCVRRFYRATSATCLVWLRVRPELISPLASVLDAYTAWLHFVWGLCLYPLCKALYMDAYASADGGIFGWGFTPLGLGLSCGLMLLAFLIGSAWALIRCVQLRHRAVSR